MNGFDMGPSQFAGGGFVPSPAAGGAHDAYGGGGGDKSNNKMAQTMRDVTVRQLIRENANASDDQYKVDGIELTTFYIVGRIIERHEGNTMLKLKVDDGTGCIEVVHYQDEDNELMNVAAQEWTVNSYVRACGTARSGRSMLALRIKPIKDFNEVTYHNLQCIFQHLHLTKGIAPAGSAPPAFGGAPAAAGGFGGGAPGGSAPASGVEKLRADVLAVYNEGGQTDRGLSVDDVLAKLTQRGVQINRTELLTTIEYLTNEGHLFSTTDDQHHKSTTM
ncbi:hypothetical protein FOA52_006855 [Chlamydomonas sp. UWO 241]|nr:hypothetical protein FOA52_006855 [Chlamydomonas sp. UWO 241]